MLMARKIMRVMITKITIPPVTCTYTREHVLFSKELIILPSFGSSNSFWEVVLFELITRTYATQSYQYSSEQV
jgi:hypothetical protein